MSKERGGRRSKLTDLDDAVSVVESGMHLAVGGIWNENTPSALVRALARSGPTNLTLSAGPASAYPVDLLIGLGLVDTLLAPNVTFEDLGLAPNHRRAIETGEISIIECDEPSLIGGYRAAAAGLPGSIVKSLQGTSLLDRSPWILPITLPSGDEVLIVPALRPDVTFLHVQECDEYGNARCLGAVFADRLLAKCAGTVVISADEVISNREVRSDPSRTTIPGFLVDAVVEAPRGAHPCGSHGRYGRDTDGLLSYLASANTGGEWQAYVDSAVSVSHEEYLQTTGTEATRE